MPVVPQPMTENSQNDYALTAHQTRELLDELVNYIDDLKAPEFATYGDLADLDYMFGQLNQLRDRLAIRKEVAA